MQRSQRRGAEHETILKPSQVLAAACVLVMCKKQSNNNTHPGSVHIQAHVISEINCSGVFTSANTETQSGEMREHKAALLEVSVMNVTSVISSMSLSQWGGINLKDCKQSTPAIPEVMELSLAESDLPVTPSSPPPSDGTYPLRPVREGEKVRW